MLGQFIDTGAGVIRDDVEEGARLWCGARYLAHVCERIGSWRRNNGRKLEEYFLTGPCRSFIRQSDGFVVGHASIRETDSLWLAHQSVNAFIVGR